MVAQTRHDLRLQHYDKNALEILLLPSRAGYCLSFTRNQGNILLWHGYGDPDSWEFMEYILKAG